MVNGGRIRREQAAVARGRVLRAEAAVAESVGLQATQERRERPLGAWYRQHRLRRLDRTFSPDGADDITSR